VSENILSPLPGIADLPHAGPHGLRRGTLLALLRSFIWFPLCASFNSCYDWAMSSIQFRAGLLSIVLMALLCGGCEKKSTLEQFADDSKSAAQKAGNSVKDAANKTKDAVKDTAQKAMDAGKEGVQKATTFATNVAGKTTTLATNVAAKAKEGAQKVESATTNIVSEIKQKVQ
jgi:hypothetical protein